MRGLLDQTCVDSSATSAIHTASPARVEAVERGGVQVELVAQHDDQRAAAQPRGGLARRQASEQYFTSAQFFAQRLRQLIGRPQATQGLLGSAALLPLKPPSC